MAQLTLTERTNLALNSTFNGKVFQALYSKANYWNAQGIPTNLKLQKQKNYSLNVLTHGGGVDLASVTRFWLSNYNADPPVLDQDGQPTDSEILNTGALEIVYDTLAGVVAGDDAIPIQ
jgi:hypothetical protein